MILGRVPKTTSSTEKPFGLAFGDEMIGGASRFLGKKSKLEKEINNKFSVRNFNYLFITLSNNSGKRKSILAMRCLADGTGQPPW